MKFFVLILTMILFFAFSLNAGYAGTRLYPEVSKKNDQKIINSSALILSAKVLSVSSVRQDGLKNYFIKPITIYYANNSFIESKGTIPFDLSITSHQNAACDIDELKPEEIKDLIVFHDDNVGDYIGGPCKKLSPEGWENLKSNPLAKLSAEQYLKKYCDGLNGIWSRTGLSDRKLCSLPTKDGGKVCKDNSECEAYCLFDTSKEFEWESIAQTLRLNRGKCDEYTKRGRCHPQLMNGRIVPKCVSE